MREKLNFCYFTGTNRPEDQPIIRGMIKRMRDAEVPEDIHVFSPQPIEGGIHHEFNGDWQQHMAKILFLPTLQNSEYDYVVWLDSDTYFVRDPGDLKELIRDEKCWVSLESNLESPKAVMREWYGLFLKPTNSPNPLDKTSPTVVELYRQYGARYCYNTNGGMFIVRRDAIGEFVAKTIEIYNSLHAIGFQNVTDEPALAIAGDLLVSEPLLNTFERHSHIWACDWHSRFQHVYPDGQPWNHKDWLTQSDLGMANPSIVHLMRGKHLLANYGKPAPENVGTKLAEIIAECGVTQPENCSCAAVQAQMNQGIDWCNQNRRYILGHLAEASDEAGWLDWMKIASRGYLSCGSLLNEAIKRSKI